MRVGNTIRVFSCLMVVSMVVVIHTLSENHENLTVAITASVQFPCDSDHSKIRIWEHGNNVVFNNRLKIGFTLDHVSLSENYSFVIRQTKLLHEGRYRCFEDGILAAEYWLNVEVPPKIFLTLNEYDNVEELTLEEGTYVTIFCHAVGAIPAANLSWTIDGKTTNNDLAINFSIRKGVKYEGRQGFDSISAYTGRFFRNNGTISCKSITASGIGSGAVNLQYNTFVSPVLSITVNNVSNKKEIYIPTHKPSLLNCYAFRSRPASKLFWFIDKVAIEESDVANENILRKNELFDTISSVEFTPQNTSGSITCVCRFSNITNHRKEISLRFNTYVIPEMHFTIDGKKWMNMSTINATLNNMIILICHADGARPLVQLWWKLQERIVDTGSVQTSNTDDQSFNITTSLQVSLNETERDVICFTRGLYDHNVFILMHIQRTVLDVTSEGNQGSTWLWRMLLVITASVFLLLTVLTVIAVRKYLGEMSFHRVRHVYQPQGNNTTNIASTVSRNSKETRGENSTKLQKGTEPPEQRPIPEDVYETYFELKDKTFHHKLFQGKDMCLILSMSSGALQVRWMGTISLSPYHQKCAVFSTASDINLKNREIHWEAYVKRVLDMPDHNSLVTLEGICVNQANLYLVHEHLTCDSLESFISSRKISTFTGGPFPSAEVASYLIDILEGMEVLHSYGFLHPGLSPRKVLVTEKGRCKLYDFYLSEDAPNRGRIIKSKKNCSLTDFPPETLTRNEYTQASDVWCVAVVLWKLMTYDLIPVVLHDTGETKACGVTPTWPENHLGLKNPILFECWMFQENFRPTIKKLRSSFQEVIGNEQAFSISEDTDSCSLHDQYVSMDGLKATDSSIQQENG